ncbi:MAG TPA: hypothetical protein VFP97_08450 [Chitinophagaceae bacterium]|nr:hypothetical protein [Chitinophagaceae bacterium]
MKKLLPLLFPLTIVSCTQESRKGETEPLPVKGTWKLITGTLIEKGDTTITDYTKNLSFIKIINDSHFSFLQHDTRKDSVNFSAGGGRYELRGNNYTEHLEYCSAKEWEGHDFNFTLTISGDTLMQQGVEKIEAQGIDRMNIEKYVRIRK